MQLWFRRCQRIHSVIVSPSLPPSGQCIPLIFESALSFPCPTSIKSNEAFPCVKPNVKSLRSSGLSSDPSRRIAFESPVIFAQTLAIISISSVSSLQFPRTAFRRALAACFPPSIPICIRSSLNWKDQTVFVGRRQKLTIIPSPSINTIM